MRVQATIYVLLLTLALRVTCEDTTQMSESMLTSGQQTNLSYGNVTTFIATRSPNITYLKNATITGKVTVKKEETPNVTCNTESGKILDLRTILTFLVGAASTAVIVCIALCFVGMCTRCRTIKAADGNANKADVQLEAVKIQRNPAGTDQVEEDEHTPLRGCPDAAATNTAAVSSEVKAEDTPGENRPSGEEEAAGEKEHKEVDYACIDYSLLQGRGAEAQKAQSEETDYAEIQIKKQEEGAEDLQSEEVQGKGQGLENQEQVEGEEEEIQV